MNIFFRLLLCLTTIIILNSVSAAQSNKAQKKAKSTKQIEAPLIISFNINSNQLPANYKGSDIVRLYKSYLNKISLTKDEYETSAQYEKRISDVVTDEIYAFKLDLRSMLLTEAYNADEQKMDITFIAESVDKSNMRAAFIIKEIDKGSDSYIGTNAFGAIQKVTQYRGLQYGIALVDKIGRGRESFLSDHAFKKTTFEFNILPEKAKMLKNNIGVLLVCVPSLYKSSINRDLRFKGNDLIFTTSYYSEATFDNPTSLSYDRKFVNAEVLAVWVYNIKTGEIVFKKQIIDLEKRKYLQRHYPEANYLIQAVYRDLHGMTIDKSPDPVQDLINLLHTSSLYDLIDSKGLISSLSKEGYLLVNETQPYRKHYTNFDKLSEEQQERIVKLNRIVLRVAYPNLYPQLADEIK